jgi:hypothetical protein
MVKSYKKKRSDEELKKEVSKLDVYQIISLKDAYLYNTLQGDYWMALYNSLVEQFNGTIKVGSIDGVEKSKDFLFSELMLYKLRAFKSYRTAYFNVEDLKKLGVSVEQLNEYVRDFQKGKVKREKYDSDMKIDSKTGFVNV